MKLTIPVLGLLALVSSAAGAAVASGQDSTKAYVTITVVTPSQSESASNESAGGSVVTVTKKIIPAASVRLDGNADLNLGQTLPPGGSLPGGGNLPTSGTPGQTYTVDTCLPRHSTTEYEFVWVPDSNGGHWEVINIKITENSKVSCV